VANGNLGEAYVEVKAKTDGVAKEIKDGVTKPLEEAQDAADGVGKRIDGGFKAAGSAVTGFAQKAAIPATIALGGITFGLKKAAMAASDLNEETSKSEQIFGSSAKQVQDFAKTAADSIGQSQTQALAAASTFGIFGNAAGLGGQELAGFSQKFTVLASDLASFNNTSPEEAITAIGAALRGESEPIRRYGVLLNDAGLKQQALKMGLIDTTTQALTPQQRVLAATELIFQQTQKAQGDFARTADGAANSQRTLNAQMTDAATKIGQSLQPALRGILNLFTNLATFISNNTTLVLVLTGVIGGLAGAIVGINLAVKIWKATTEAAAVAQKVWNAAMEANPIGLIVTAVVLLGVVLVAAYKKFDGFRIVVNTVINAVIGYFEFMVNAWIKAINTFTAGINKFTGLFKYVGINIGKIGEIGEVSFGRLDTSVKKATGSAADFRKAEEADKAAIEGAGNAATTTAGAMDDLGGKTKGAGDAADAAAKKIKDLRDSFGKGFEDTLKRAGDMLRAAKDEFSKFAESVSDAITKSFSFSEAYDSGKETGKGFLTALNEQAVKVKTFGELVNRLLAAGLSQDALQQVLAAGVDTGSAIARELLASTDNILKANTLAADVAAIGSQVGLSSAITFKQAGVDAGTALVAGINETINKYKVKLKSKKLSAKQLKKLQEQFAVDVEFAFSNVPAMASGGVVGSPSMALIGEAGAEAVIPITRPARALDIMEQTGLAALARANGGAIVSIGAATFIEPTDADLLAQKVLAAEKIRTFNA